MKNGWQTKTLGDVCERVTVGHVGITSPYYRDDGILFLRTQNVGKSGLVLDDMKYVTPEFHASLKKSEVKAGDILMSRVITHTVHCALIPPELGPANCANVVLVRPSSGLLPEFLAHYIRSPEAQRHLLDRKVGSAQLVVNTKVVQTWPIPIPPLREQQRIVGILDEAFEGVATAKANAEKNVQNGRALFESHLESTFSHRGKDWEKHSLISVSALFVDSAHRTPKYQDQGIPALRPRDVVNGTLDLEGALRVSEEEYQVQSKRHKPSPGDIVYSRELSYGWAAQLPKSPRVCLSQGMCLFRPASKLDAAFLLHVLNGPIGRKQAARAAVGAAHPHINLGDIKSYMIPLPSLDTQRQIGQEFDALTAETQRLESIYERKVEALEDLKKSLLHEAFAGNL